MLKLGYSVKSSQISYLGHDSKKSILVVCFKPDKNNEVAIYEYQNVTETVFDSLMTSDSRGSYFIKHIKKDTVKYPFLKTQLTDPESVFEKILDESLFGVPLAHIPEGSFQIPQSFLKSRIAANASWCW
jgi:KTSC domain